MAHTGTIAKQLIKPKTAAVVIGILLVIGLLIALTPWVRPAEQSAARPAYASYPVCPDAKDFAVTAAATAVEIKSYCRSGWLKLPPSTNFRVDAPGEVEYCFWSGQCYLVSDEKTRWGGNVPHSIVRLRGKSGTAVLYLEK